MGIFSMNDDSDRLMSRQIAWAHTYNGYDRLAGGVEGGPEALARVLEPAWREYQGSSRVPTWCGVDLLRGWAFYLTRADRHGGGYDLAKGDSKVSEWQADLTRVVEHPNVRPEERPPLATVRVPGPPGRSPPSRDGIAILSS